MYFKKLFENIKEYHSEEDFMELILSLKGNGEGLKFRRQYSEDIHIIIKRGGTKYEYIKGTPFEIEMINDINAIVKILIKNKEYINFNGIEKSK